MIGTVKVRVIDAQITVTCADGTVFTGSYRLVTTLTDARRYPAAALVRPLPPAVGTRIGVLRAPPHDHGRPRPALGRPGRRRAGDVVPAHALPGPADGHGRRRRVPARAPIRTAAASPSPSTPPATRSSRPPTSSPRPPSSVGLIGRRILAGLLPPRRHRVSTRKVKSPMSRYSERHDDGRPDTSRTVTGLDITVLEPAAASPPARTSPATTGTPPLSRPPPAPHPGPPPGRPRTPLAPPRHRQPPRRHHPRRPCTDNSPAGPTDGLIHKARPRPLRRHAWTANTPCVTCENANYPALGLPPANRGHRLLMRQWPA